MATISSNIPSIVAGMKSAGAAFEDNVDKAIGDAAKAFLGDCITEIDALIYSQPTTSHYPKRTKFLRRSHHIKKLRKMFYLIFNDAHYAEPVHDGLGPYTPVSRPWMDIALQKNEKKYEQIIGGKVEGAFE